MELPATDRWTEINALLREVQAQPVEERGAFLKEACGDDDALRQEVKDLLEAVDTFGDVLEQGAAPLALPLVTERGRVPIEEAPAPLGRGRRVGPYRLLEQIGMGGTSAVYRAERADGQFERTVAVKVLRHSLGMDKETHERFQVERQVLASVSHPNLAEVYDGGVLEDGRPYLVMEYVEGRAVTEHVQVEGLPIRTRLRLFRQAATAVQAAHEQLVVHRDLKPSNVLVERETGTVKLLDFGIAKILGELPGGPDPITQTGRQPMTPAYAAPEQVKGDPISVATDTYALGVLLYELLSDVRAYGGAERSPYAVARAVCEDEPPPPSEVVPDPERRRALQGDLDAIVTRALRKDPEARYDTVDDLVDDLDRHLDGRPVRATKGGWRYRTRKFVRRHQIALLGSLLALFLLVGFALYHVQRLGAERDQARQAAEEARREARTARAVSSFMRTILGRSPDKRDPSAFVSGVELFVNVPWADTLRSQIRGSLADLSTRVEHPESRAAILHTVAQLLQDNNEHAWADSLLRRSLALRGEHRGPTHPSTMRTLGLLARTNFEGGRKDSARVYLRRYLKRQKKRGVPDSAAYGAAMWRYAVTLRDSARRVRRFDAGLRLLDKVHGPRSRKRAQAELHYATQVSTPRPKGLEDAISILRRRDDSLSTDVVFAHLLLGEDYVQTGQVNAGLQHARTAIRRFDSKNATTWHQYARLKYAELLLNVDRQKEARDLLLDIRVWQDTHLPTLHKDRATLLHLLGRIDLREKRYEVAESRFRSALHGTTILSGPMIQKSRRNRYYLARTLWEQGKRTEAATLLQQNAGVSGRGGEWVKKSRRLLDRVHGHT